MTDNYIHIILISAAIGLIDYTIKGTVIFNKLPKWLRGYSWHISIALLYTSCIVFYAWAHGWIFLWGILSFINEDLFYYIFKSIDKQKLCFNEWAFKSSRDYLLFVLALNTILFFILFWARDL